MQSSYHTYIVNHGPRSQLLRGQGHLDAAVRAANGIFHLAVGDTLTVSRPRSTVALICKATDNQHITPMSWKKL